MSRKPFIFIGLLIVITLLVNYITLGGIPFVALSKTQPLTGAASQAIGAVNKNGKLPVNGKDFILNDIRYFDDNWVVATVSPTSKSQLAQATVIMQKVDGAYRVVLGPGTTFDNSITFSLPTDLGDYLTQRGLLYEFNYQ